MTASATMNKQIQEEQERHDLLEKLNNLKGVEFDPDMSLDGLRELYATFGPNAAARNAQVEPKRANEEATPPARELETDETDEDGEIPPGDEELETDEPKPDPEGKALFDRSEYEREDLQIQKVDGQGVDKIRVKFAGSVMLDRSAPADVALYNRLALGKEVELRCAGKVSGTSTGWTTNRDGDLDAIVGERTLKVETVWVLAPEELS